MQSTTYLVGLLVLLGLGLGPSAAKATPATSTKLIPLPIYATNPNEGDTWGFLPVFLTVENPSQRTRSIIAPSESWNRIIRFTTTFRYYYYPTDEQSLTIIPSFSTNVNRGLTFEYLYLPREKGRWTFEAVSKPHRSIFYRFFGIGPDASRENETSYTRVGGDLELRWGLNLSRDLNLGLFARGRRELVERRGVDFRPLIHDRFPNVPGLAGSTILTEGLSLRYDSRPSRQYSTEGLYSEVTAAISQGLSNSPAFHRFSWESRLLWPESAALTGGARILVAHTGGSSDIPFYYLNSLGGSYRLRGFNDGRFFDRGAWALELEQRLVIFKTHIYAVDTDWRIDPFFSVGQVYDDYDKFFSRVRPTGGLGFRAFVRPNVLGRVDVAYSIEGAKFYVELGYPF